MSSLLQRAGRRGFVAAASGLLAVGGLTAVTAGLQAGARPPQPQGHVQSTTVSTADPQPPALAAPAVPAAEVPDASALDASAPDVGPVLGGSPPVALTIPAIDVAARSIVPLVVGADGVLAAPEDYAVPGWHVAGPMPGQMGPAVIVGHVDSPDGPAVLYRLGELLPGDSIDVPREDGSVASFVVDSVERFRKTEFPTTRVYGSTTGRAEIRLITCGGAFDRGTGHYVDNVVAFGHLVSP